MHGTTNELLAARWKTEQLSLQPLDGRPPYPYVDDELRKVARDAYVSWEGSRYSVPWSRRRSGIRLSISRSISEETRMVIGWVLSLAMDLIWMGDDVFNDYRCHQRF